MQSLPAKTGRYLVARRCLLPVVASTFFAGGPTAESAQTNQDFPPDHAATIRQMLTDLNKHGEFNGSLLAVQGDKVVFRESIAATPAETAALLARPSNIASLAKSFTAMSIMILAERGKLNYDDPIARHVKDLSSVTPSITLRHLLTHTSGIPDVGDLGIDRPKLRKRDLISALQKNHKQFAKPGTRYRYSNTGYMLLGMAVENASGGKFDDFQRTTIFNPLGMTSTRPEHGPRDDDETKGEGGLLSTLDDLLKWHKALSGETLVKAKTFAEALAPAKIAEGHSPYGFGWNIAQKDGDTYMWHTGNSGAQRAFIGRRLRDKIAVVILTDGDSRRVEIADAVISILQNRPFDPPKLSISRVLIPIIQSKGIDDALAKYEELRTSAAKRYDFSEPQLNNLGYALLSRRMYAEAIRVFELNVRHFPTSGNAFDSLGDALNQSGKRSEAAKAYARAVELDPSNINARQMLQKLN